MFGTCSFKPAAEWLVAFFLDVLAASLPAVEDAQVSTLLSADDNWLLSAVGVVTADRPSTSLFRSERTALDQPL